jgi:WXG100 family type VII secretion target
MPYLHINFPALEQAAVDIYTTMNRLDSGLETLATSLRPMVDTWDGDAQQAFQERQQKWTSAADSIQKVLLDWKAKTEAAHARSVATEGDNSRMLAI